MENRKKIKIAYLNTIFYEILFARFAENFIHSLNKEKYAMSFIGVNVKESFNDRVSKDVFLTSFYIPIKFPLFKLPIVLFKLMVHLKKEKPDILVSAAPLVNVISIMAKVISGAKTKVILTEHNVFSLLAADVLSPYKRFAARFILPFFMRIFYPQADALVCVSKGVAEDLCKVINYKNKVQVIYNPVFGGDIYGLSEEHVDHPWFLNKTPIILAAGRLVSQKDYPTLLKSFKLVVRKKPARLIILGEGALREKLEDLILELGISENVAFLGFVDNQYKYIKRASVLVLSSAHEGFGNGIVDAMALGVPVISTDCKSGPNEIIEDGKSGILVPVGDYNAMSEAILKVLNSASLWQKLSLEGRKRAECFSFKTRVKEYEELFQKIMNQN